MKKSTRALLMATLCMVIAGSAFCIAGVCFGFTFAQFTDAMEKGKLQIELPAGIEEKLASQIGEEERTADADSAAGYDSVFKAEYEQSFTGIDSMDLDLGVGECRIILWDEEMLKVLGSRLPSGFECRKDGTELELDCEKADWKFWEDMEGAALELYVPKNQMMEKVVISAGVGNIQVENGYLQCEELKLDCGVGESSLKIDASRKVEIDGGVGEVFLELKGKEKDFDYNLDNGVGSVVIGSTHLKDLGMDERIDNGSSKEVTIDNGIGSVTIIFSED